MENVNEEGRTVEGKFKRTNSTNHTFLAKTPEERNWRLDENF
jgi:hypothetical protein